MRRIDEVDRVCEEEWSQIYLQWRDYQSGGSCPPNLIRQFYLSRLALLSPSCEDRSHFYTSSTFTIRWLEDVSQMRPGVSAMLHHRRAIPDADLRFPVSITHVSAHRFCNLMHGLPSRVSP